MTRRAQRLTLLNPGPVNVSARVRAAFDAPDECHREPEFLALVSSVRDRLVSCFGDPAVHSVALLTGSGTAAVEAMIASGVGDGTLLVVDNGLYGQRMRDIALAHAIPVREHRSSWTGPLDVDALERTLLRDPRIEAIAMVHHETTTGLLNPVATVGALAAQHGKRFLVDSVSGLGGDEIDLAGDHVDLCAGSANKCLQGMPGVSFVLARRDALDNTAGRARRTLYLDLYSHIEAQDAGGLLFTMAVQTVHAFDAALAELQEETVQARIRRYQRAAAILRAGFEALDLELVVPSQLRSSTITALRLPPGIVFDKLHDGLKLRGFVVYPGAGKMSAEVWRVGNMGDLTPADFRAFLEALAEALPQLAGA